MALSGWHLPFHWPLFEGAGGAADIPGLFACAIGGHEYEVEVSQIQLDTLDAFRESQDVSATPGESSLSTEGAWLRSQSTWHRGAGQEFYDDPDSDQPEARRRARFWRSKGIDVWTRNQATLLPGAALRTATSDANATVVPLGDYLYLIDGQTLKYGTDGINWTTVMGTPAVNLNAIATDGTLFYLATDDGVYVGDLGVATCTQLVPTDTMAFQSIAFVNGRLVAGQGGDLVELAADGTPTTIISHFASDFRWTVLCGGPTKLYAGGALNGLTDLRRLGVAEDGSLTDEGSALPLPRGESLRAMVTEAGSAVLATSAGVRFAAIDADGGLTYGPVIDEPGDVRCLAVEGRFVWFGWTNYDADSTGLGRLDLQHFSGELTPAFASDLMVEGQGTVRAVLRHADATWFVVEGVGLHGHSLLVEASGTLETGWIDLNLPVDKVFTKLDLRHDPLPPLCGITATVIGEDESEGVEAVSNVANSTRPPGPLSLGNTRGERIRLRFTLTRGSDTEPSVLRRWMLSAFVTPRRQDVMVLPLIMRSRVLAGAGQGQAAPIQTLEEYQYLRALALTGQVVLLQLGALAEQVKVNRLRLQPGQWNPDRTFFEAILNVELLTV